MTSLEDIALSTKKYPYESWGQKFKNNKVILSNSYVHYSWRPFFDAAKNKDYFKKIEEFLSFCLEQTAGKIKIYPYPDLVFNAFNTTHFNNVKVCILGMDPYFNNEIHHDTLIPLAMGLSFSVPVGIKIPSSLNNIYKNLLKYKHISKIPNHGNLISWSYQGVLLLNVSLTVQQSYAGSHLSHWTPFTDELIKYISDTKNNIIFVLWGAPALAKSKLIDTNKHKIIISSHPSGLSCNNKLKQYSSFVDQDHFGLINTYLKHKNEKEIIWRL